VENNVYFFELTTDPDDERLLSEVAKLSGGAIDKYGDTGVPSSWLDHEATLLKLSSKYKNVLFTLRAEENTGADDKDDWVKYFYNGKLQVAPRVSGYAEFDKSKLVLPPRKGSAVIDINDIMDIVHRSYDSDEITRSYWNATSRRPKRGSGDTLAKFVVEEIYETYDDDATNVDKFKEAERVMRSAARQLNTVADAIVNEWHDRHSK
jgi:hypothetical protein